MRGIAQPDVDDGVHLRLLQQPDKRLQAPLVIANRIEYGHG
jgi:hypothetical protein